MSSCTDRAKRKNYRAIDREAGKMADAVMNGCKEDRIRQLQFWGVAYQAYKAGALAALRGQFWK